MNKQAELSALVDYHKPQIVAITETWLNDSIKFSAFSNDYNVYRCDRKNARGGGVLLAVKSNLQCKFVESFSLNNCECLFLDILLDSSNYMRYGIIYRPPDTNYNDSLTLYNKIYSLVENVKHYTLLGDFNIPDIDWKYLTAHSNIGREFLTFCFKIGAIQLVDFPTRLDSLIDLLLCSDRNFVKSVYSDMPFSTSDHNIVICELLCLKDIKIENIVRPCFQKADFNLINAFLGTLNWDEIYLNCTTTEEYWSAFKGILDTIIVNFVPMVSVNPRKQKPWFDGKLKRLRLIKQRRWHTYSNNRNIVTYANYKSAAKNFRSEFLLSKANYEKKLFDNNDIDSKKFHKYVKGQTHIHTGIPCLKRNDGTLASSDYDKACIFNEYFSSVFTRDNNCMPNFNPVCHSSLDGFTCTVYDVIKSIRKLKNNSAPGLDNYTPLFLKNILAHIATPLTKLYSVSLSEGSVPNDWKIAVLL